MRQIKIINSFTNRNEESLDKYLVDETKINGVGFLRMR